MKQLKKRETMLLFAAALLENDHLNDDEKLAQFMSNNNNAMAISVQFVCMFDEFRRRENPFNLCHALNFSLAEFIK